MENNKPQKLINSLLVIAYFLNLISCMLLILNSNNCYFLLIFIQLVIYMSLVEQHDKVNTKIMYLIVICFVLHLPVTLFLMYFNKSILNCYVTYDKELFYFVYYKKVDMSLLLFPFIVFEGVLTKLLHKLKFKALISFILTLLLLIIYNQLNF